MARNNPTLSPVAALMRLAAEQAGVFTASQAAALGVTYHQLATMVDKGVVLRRRRSLYVVAGAPDGASQRTMEAVLSGPPGCVASHDSAAHFLGLVDQPSQVHVTVGPTQRLRCEGVVAHRSVLPPSHVATIGRMPVTSLARTIVDLASVSDLDRLAEILDPLLVSGRLQPGRLLRVVDEIVVAPGRHGTNLLRTALDVWMAPIQPGSAAEVRLLRRLHEQGFGGFVTQHEVVANGSVFRLDVAWPEDKVLLEYSGRAFHGPRRWERDERRATLLKMLGWAYREVDATDLVPGATALWTWLRAARRSVA